MDSTSLAARAELPAAPTGCLFASDSLDDPSEFVGLCEWRGDAPFPHLLLLTGRPRLRALPLPGSPRAIVADYRQGLLHLSQFLARVQHPPTREPRARLVEHLRSPVFRRTYAVMMWRDLFQSRSRDGDRAYDRAYRNLCELNDQPARAWWFWRRGATRESLVRWSCALGAMR